jgi:hypothetical protein
MMYRTLHHMLILDHVDSKACALRKGAELIVDRHHLDLVSNKNERRLVCTLVVHVLMDTHSAEGKSGVEDKRTSMQSMAVRSSSTTTASMLRPRMAEMALSYLRGVGLYKSTNRPRTPVLMEKKTR